VREFRAMEGSGRRCPKYPWQSQSECRQTSTTKPIRLCKCWPDEDPKQPERRCVPQS